MTNGVKRLLLAVAGACLLLAPLWCAPQAARESDSISQLLRKGRHAQAADLARTTLASLKAGGKGESLEAADLLAKLARALWAGGKVKDADARRSAERALSIREKLLGSDHPLVGSSLSDLATVLQMLGEYAAALPLSERAVAIQRNARSASPRELAESLDALGAIRYRTGNIQGALSAFSEALAIFEKSMGADSLEAAQALSDVGVAQQRLGNSRQARISHERALAIRRKKLGPDHFLVAASLNNLANVLYEANDLRGALPLQEEAMRIREKQLSPEHPNIANGLNNLGMLRLRLGEYREAAGLFERSLAIRERAYGPLHWEIAQSLDNLAHALKGEGKPEMALDAALRADFIFRSQARYILRILSEREATRFLDMRLGLDTGLALATEGHLASAGQTPRIWDVLLRSRGLVFDEMVVRKAEMSTLYGTAGAAAGIRLDAARSRYAAALTGASKKQSEIAEARTAMESAERELARGSLRFRRELRRANIGYEDILAALPRDSALIAYAAYRPNDFSEERHIVAFVLRAGSDPVTVPIGSQKQIDGLVSAWRKEIVREAEAPGRSSRRNEAACRQMGGALRRRIWDPVAARLGDAKRVFVVPDGPLNLVNFAALPVSGGRYLAESGPVIHFLNTERDLTESAQEGPLGEGLLAIGDPDFDLTGHRRHARAAIPTRGMTPACFDLQQLRFDRLPGSATEVDGVAGIWSRAHGSVTVLKGARATESELRRTASGKRVLHIATHGFFYDRLCGTDNASSRQPWQFTGLALAGANVRGKSPGSGILTAETVASLDLDGAQWVVLSGCDTGLGRIETHEGVFGLRRAFQLAGARTVIMSLWPVDDDAARQWMLELYKARFEKELDTPQSVRNAYLRVLRSRRSRHLSTHPFYWAGFVAAGDWK